MRSTSAEHFAGKNSHATNARWVVTTMATVVLWSLALAPIRGQAPALARAETEASAARAKQLAQQFDEQARVLTVFDRAGKVVTTVGERGIYEAPVFSRDRTRLAVIKSDLGRETVDLWVLDVATGAGTRITSNQMRRVEQARWPIWSPDGSQLAFVALRNGYWGLYRKASNGQGREELLYQSPGANLVITDWSADGRFLHFHSTNLSGGTLYALPMTGDGDRPAPASTNPNGSGVDLPEARQPIVVLRNEFQLRGARVSPDGRWLAYQSNQSGKDEIYVRPFETPANATTSTARGPWQVSDGIQASPAFWRQGGGEVYYVAADRGVMAVSVKTTPTFTFTKPKLLFRLSEAVAVNGATTSISHDGERIVIAVPSAPVLQQITVLDRQGKVVSKLGEPGRYQNPVFSPDGTRIAVRRTDPHTNNVDIWTFDVVSGRGTPVTNDTSPDTSPVWSPDGIHVAYASARGSLQSIFRKAWDGSGEEEQLFQYTPGAFMQLSDWSADGKFLAFHDNCWGVLHVLPLRADQSALEREAIDWLRDEYENAVPRFSPDSRFMAYLSDEFKTEIDAANHDVYVRPFEAGKSDVSAGGANAVKVSTAGALSLVSWRQDGREMYYLTPDWEVTAVEVSTVPTFQAETPRLLFKLPGRVSRNPGEWGNVSRDGQRFVFTLNVPASLTR